MQLIVCEKQVAAKRIAELLGGNSLSQKKKYRMPYYELKDSLVVGLSGHVLKVDFPEKFSSWSKVPFSELVKAPIVYAPDKLSIIKLVKFLAKQSSELVIATDFDTEGESIGLEAVTIIKEVKDLPVKRARFSAFTKTEVMNAFDSLVDLDENLALSADARREIDLIWGAVLTRFLSVSAKRLGRYYLSAGRVQSPTLSLIVEKEKERLKFKPVPYWEFPLIVSKNGESFEAEHDKVFDEVLRDELKALNPEQALVKGVSVTKKSTNPPSPFNTTGFLRAAASLGFSGSNAMRIAEGLYLKGLISYPRTDNQVYPESIDFKKILELFRGSDYAPLLKFLKSDLKPTRGKKESKDHPPIHPTGAKPGKLEGPDFRVYDLIVRRFIATFSDKSLEERTKVELGVCGHEFKSSGYRLVSPGWRMAYHFSQKDDNILPKLVEGDSLLVKSLKCLHKETSPPNRYGHGSIIKAMSDLNLGTKSTRPSIIDKLMARNYLFKSSSLTPTPIAMAVMNALDSYANLITEPVMTQELESDMELIANGEVSKDVVVSKSRDLLMKALKQLEFKQEVIASDIREGIRRSKIIGECPNCGGDLKIINARSRFVGCSGYPDCHTSYPLPQHGFLQLSGKQCKSCGLKELVLVRKRKRPFSFCPNIDCPSRDDDEESLALRKKRDEYIAGLKKKEVSKTKSKKKEVSKTKSKKKEVSKKKSE